MSTSGRDLKRYQLQWQPSFPATINGDLRIYVIGENVKYVGPSDAEPNLRKIDPGFGPSNLNTEELIRVGYNSTIILPFNTGVALAQEYTPSIKNKVVQYHTLGGNSITSFGPAIKKVGLAIKIIKAGRLWETYVSGLEALTYLSANQGRYYGSLYLAGYDMFDNNGRNAARYRGRYKVTVESLDIQQRSDSNTVATANLQMLVTNDYTHQASGKARIWGSL